MEAALLRWLLIFFGLDQGPATDPDGDRGAGLDANGG